MTIEELKDKGAIYFEKIAEGLGEYADVTLKMDEKKALAHFKSLRKEYGAEQSFVDFYYYRLDVESREMVDELLTQEEISYLALLQPFPDEVEEQIIFPLDEKLLKIVIRLNAEEMLFSTIYFANGKNGRARTTWWGNYEQEYICFKDK